VTESLDERLARCEELRLRVLRGDGALGILPAEQVRRLEREYRELAAAGVTGAWVGLARYHLDPNGLAFSVPDATRCACRAVALGSAEGRDELLRALPAFRSAGAPDPEHARAASDAVERALADDADGRWHHLAGFLAFHGFGRAEDAAACARLHRVAAERGEPDAMFELCVLYMNGVGVAQDRAEALAWCRKAARLGQPRACYNLGAFLATGNGLPQDLAEAQVWYGRASDAGHARATATLAVMVARGEGSTADPARARQLVERAAEQGFDTEGMAEELGL